MTYNQPQKPPPKAIGLALLGSTGSIGRQTLEVVRALPGVFKVIALAAGTNVTLLEEQAREFAPNFIYAGRQREYLDQRIGDGYLRCRWASMEEMVSHPDVDVVVIATVGAAGLGPTLAALRAGKAIALANKEVLVMAGELITTDAKRYGAQLRPIDSEHSALWQCLWGEDPASVEGLTLTASGGAFRDTPTRDLARVSAQDALRHPNWRMGRKITVDSATLFNKGLECIEARWLFDMPLDRIDVVIHRESIVHSLVQFRDGSVKAQLGMPDMRLPIQCALTYPERISSGLAPRLDLRRVGTLTFEPVDMKQFPCLGLALEAGRHGGTYPAVLAAADEIAVKHFLSGHLSFLDIPRLVEDTVSAHSPTHHPILEEILAADSWARAFAQEWTLTRA